MIAAFLCAVAHAQAVDPRIAPVDALVHVNADFQRNVSVVSSQQTFSPNTSTESKITSAGDSSHANVTGVTQQQSGPNMAKPSAASTWGPQPLTRGAAGPQSANITDSAKKPPTGASRAKPSSATSESTSEEGSSSDEDQTPYRTGVGKKQLSSNHSAQMKKHRRPTAAGNVCPAEPRSIHPTACEIMRQQSAIQTGTSAAGPLASPVRHRN